MKIEIVGFRKITKKGNKEWINVQARFPTTHKFCNLTGARVGDFVLLEIKNKLIKAKVSDNVTVPFKLLFNKREEKRIKLGKRLKKIVNIRVANVIKTKPEINEDESFVALLAHLFSDGCITSRSIDFTNTKKELINHFTFLMSKVFPTATINQWVDGNIIHVKIKNTKVLSIFTRFVDKFGRKSIINPHVPKFIKNNETFSRIWLRHVFGDEGWVSFPHTVHLSRAVRFQNEMLRKSLKWKKEQFLKGNFPVISAKLSRNQLKLVPENNLISDEANMLKSLGINCTLSLRRRVRLIGKDISAVFELSLRAKDFASIGFCCSKKQKKLEKCLMMRS